MPHKILAGRTYLIVLALITTASLNSHAQATRNLVTQQVDETQLVTLVGNMHPAARAENDQGMVDDSLPMEHVIMVLKRTPEQQQALTALIDQLHDPKSPAYHQWLTPEEFGEQFGASASDLTNLTQWMGSHGFTIDEVAPGRNLVIFSGTAGQVREAFHTEIHHYLVNGEQHYASASEPMVPAALAPLIAGFRSLHDIRPKSLKYDAGVARHSMKNGEWEKVSGPLSVPELTFTYNSNSYFFVSPQDFYTIYNENPLFGQTPKIDGHGVTIAVIEETNVAHTSDVTSFRQQFGLPAYPATPNSTDGGVNWIIGPGSGCGTVGVTSTGEEGEALLDVEWAGAVAPKAIVDFVACGGANGIDLSAQYVTNHLASTVAATSLSYGECEISGGSSGATFFKTQWEQEAAEGITPVVSSGDSGSLGCDQDYATGTHNLSVNEMSDTPYNISAGGTDFSDFYQAQNYNSYWNTANSTVPNGSSALSYIPEITWGSFCANTLFASYLQQTGSTTFGTTYTPEGICNSTNANPSHDDLVAPVGGGGGVSADTPLPTWQSVYGVGLTSNQTSTTHRNQPDLSLFASNGWWGHALVYCQSDTGYSCDYSNTGNDTNAYNMAAGGTSFVAPQLNGMMALIVQKTGARQGVANYTLYNLATLEYGTSSTPNNTNLSACSGSGQAGTSVGAGCNFRDIAGDTPNPWQGGTLTSDIIQPCVWSSVQNCYRSSSAHAYGLSSLGTHPTTDSPAYPSSKGYDAATGLGSPNIANLVNNWNTVTPLFASTTAISANPTSFASTASTRLTATVTATGRGENATAGPPAIGIVSFYIGSTSGTLLGTAALTQACTGTAPSNLVCPPSTATLSVQGTSLAIGANSLIAYFPGDGANDAPSTSSTVTVTVTGSQISQTITFPTIPTQTYGVSPITLIATASSGLPVSYAVTSGPATVSGSTLTIKGAGSVTVQASQAGNSTYAPATPMSQTFAVNPAVLTVTANAASMTYGGAVPSFSASYSGFVNGDTLGSAVTGSPNLTTTATSSSAAGSYSITVAQGTLAAVNYTFSLVNGTLTISTAPLVVAANNALGIYGQPLPGLSYGITGFVNGDTQAVVSGTASLTTSATPTSTPGVYPIIITQGTLAATNYTFSFVNAILTLQQAGSSATVTSAVSNLYPSQSTMLTATVSVSGSGAAPSGTVNFMLGTNLLGTETVTPTDATDSSASLTLNGSQLTLGANSITIVYSGDTHYAGSTSGALTETLLSPLLNFGTVNVGTAAAVQTLTYSFTSAATLSAINILTLGAPRLDYTDGGNSTCTVSTAYTAGQSCTVTVAFTPSSSGLRAGAVTLFAQGNNLPLMTWYASGIGQSGDATIDPGTQSTVASLPTGVPYGLTADGAGNLYVVDNANGQVIKVAAGSLTQSTVVSSLNGPTGVTLDGAGNLYITDSGNNRLVMVPNENGTLNAADLAVLNASGLVAPQGVAVDGSGNVYIADAGNGRVVEVAAGTGALTTLASGLTNPHGLALDAASNVYVSSDSQVSEYPAGGGSATPLGAGYSTPQGLAVDASGAVFVADTGNARIVRVAPGGGSQSILSVADLTGPRGVALDAAGNVYVTDQANLYEVNRTQPAALAFGNQSINSTSAAQAVTLFNGGNGMLSITNVAATGDFAQTDNCGSSLAAGSSCALNVTFTPTATGTRSGSLTVTDNSNGVSDSMQTVSLTGTGTGAPVAGVSPLSLTFGNQNLGTTSGSQPVTLSNTGTAALTLSGITASANFGQTNNCAGSVAAGGSCTINVTFSPTATGTLNGTLTITDNAGGSPQTVSLSGTGTNPATSFSPTSQSFGSQVINTTSGATRVTLTSAGTTNLNIANISITGTNASDFAQTNTCPASLAPGAMCTFTLTYTPSVLGAETASLTVTDNASNSPQTVTLSGSGVLPVVLNPTSLNFGTQVVGTPSTTLTIMLTNAQTTALAISSITASGDFSQTNTCGSSLPARGSCTISVTLTPSILGAETGTLTINDGASTSPQTAALSGTGVAPAAVSPTTVAFAQQRVGTTSSPSTVMLVNNLSTALPISITFTGADPGDFAQTNTCGGSVAAKSHCTISITFTPASTGTRTATLNVNDGANNSPQAVALTGTGH